MLTMSSGRSVVRGLGAFSGVCHTRPRSTTALRTNEPRRCASVRAMEMDDVVEPQYAKLHDFCMQIPYGLIIAATGVVLGIRGPIAAGVLLFLAGVGILQCARASLRAWKLGRGGTAYTAMCMFISAYLTYIWGIKFKMMMVKVEVWGTLILTPPFVLFFLSALMTLFCIYNITAGGNPPKRRD